MRQDIKPPYPYNVSAPLHDCKLKANYGSYLARRCLLFWGRISCRVIVVCYQI